MNKIDIKNLEKTHSRLAKTIKSITPNFGKSYNILKNIDIPDNFNWADHFDIAPNGYQGVTGACFLFAGLYSFKDRYGIALGNSKYTEMSFIAAAAMMSILVPNTRPLDGGSPKDFTDIFVNGGFTVPPGNDIDDNFSKFCDTVKDEKIGCCDDTDGPGYCQDVPDNNQEKLDKFLKNRDRFGMEIYNSINPKYPDPSIFSLSYLNIDRVDFSSLKQFIHTGPIPFTFFFNGDFYRSDYRETGGIYICTDWQDSSNPFGYTHGDSGGPGGHCVSLTGYGTDTITINYNGKRYDNVKIDYVIIRNSWGDLNPHPKCAWEQTVNLGGKNVKLMNDVWRDTSIINISRKDTSDKWTCDNEYGNPGVCVPYDNVSQPNFRQGIYSDYTCSDNCEERGDMYKCENNQCVKCDKSVPFPSECSYISSDCDGKCKTFKCVDSKCVPCKEGEQCTYKTSDCSGKCVSYSIVDGKCVKCLDDNCRFPDISSCEKARDNTGLVIAVIVSLVICIILITLIFLKNLKEKSRKY